MLLMMKLLFAYGILCHRVVVKIESWVFTLCRESWLQDGVEKSGKLLSVNIVG